MASHAPFGTIAIEFSADLGTLKSDVSQYCRIESARSRMLRFCLTDEVAFPIESRKSALRDLVPQFPEL